MTGTLMVFAREPVPGRVKTRLIPALGAQGSAALYRTLLEKALEAADPLVDVERELWCAGAPSAGSVCAHLAQRHGMTYRMQCTGDLGARMADAFERTLNPGPAPGIDLVRVGGPAVLIGSDCPGYHSEYLAGAFAALQGPRLAYDAVLGPALDGGYVLIGLRRPAPRLFSAMPWGTDAVLGRTRQALTDLRLRWLELSALADLDRPEDLADFPTLATPLRRPMYPE